MYSDLVGLVCIPGIGNFKTSPNNFNQYTWYRTLRGCMYIGLKTFKRFYILQTKTLTHRVKILIHLLAPFLQSLSSSPVNSESHAYIVSCVEESSSVGMREINSMECSKDPFHSTYSFYSIHQLSFAAVIDLT